jgi:DNA polymerase I-like protein with 3'-5' exonuclease and polymerase domains
MIAAEAIALAAAAKVRVTLKGDRLALEAPREPPQAVLEALRQNKAAILKFLREPRTFVLDFETFYSKDFTLKRLTTEAYIRDEQFEPLVLVVKSFGLGEALTLLGPEEIEAWIRAQYWPSITVIAHNAAFDVGILSYRYGAIPAAIRCTMSLARGVLADGASLEALAKRFGLPTKTVPYGRFIGQRWADMDERLRLELADGCVRDVEITEALAQRFLDGFPPRELDVIDMTIRMATEPRLVADPARLRAIAEEHHARKAERMAALGVTAKQLNSSAQFVALLEEVGEIVPSKQGKKGPIPAIAKSDPFMQELAEEEGLAGDLARARLDVKSTLQETRAFRMADVALRGTIPANLLYCGAHSSRWSGSGGKLNLQNLPRDGVLRETLYAPPDHKLVIADFSQIEFRILMALADEHDVLQAFLDRRDLYCEFASVLYGRPITDEDIKERLLGKVSCLSLGYMAGKIRFAAMCRNFGLDLPRELTDKAHDLFRQIYPGVPKFWDRCAGAIRPLAGKADLDFEAGCGLTIPFRKGAIVLPNGLRWSFDLTWVEDDSYNGGSWIRHTRRNNIERFHQGVLTNNICQSLARVCLSDVVLRAWDELHIRPTLLVHDEAIWVVPEEDAETTLKSVLTFMGEPPAWWSDGVPLEGKGCVSDNYVKP